jgi:ureidoglycolate lyase
MPDLHPRALTPEDFAPFGAVIASRSEPSRPCNHDTGQAWDELALLESLRGESAKATASLFRLAPHLEPRLEVRWLERHPHSTQLFAPMNAGRYLVVVALGGDAPDLSTLAAFIGEARQAMTYAPGVWHHPMVALDREIDFVNLLYVDGTAEDCDEREYDPPCATVAIPA